MATTAEIFFKLLTSGTSNTDATSYAMSSVAPTSGQVVLAFSASLKATTPDTPTASGTNGFSGSWTQIGSTITIQTPAGNYVGGSWFWTIATSSVAGVVTLNYTNTQLASVWGLVQSPFINTTTPVPQSNTATDTSSNTALPAVTLSGSLGGSFNQTLVAMFHNSGTNIALGAGQIYNIGNAAASDGLAFRVAVLPATGYTPVSGTYVASVGKAIFAVEVQQDNTALPGGPLIGGRLIR